MATRTITSPEVEHIVDSNGLLSALDRAHRALATGRAQQPVPVPFGGPHDLSEDAPTAVPMLSFDADLGLFAIKLLADAPRNRAIGLPAQRSTVSLFSADTAECLAIVDGRALTRIRTAAVTALATRALARPDARSVALLGAGPLAIEHAVALSRVRELDDIRLWSRSGRSAGAAAAQLVDLGLPATAVDSLESAVASADIVCTLTPSVEPFLHAGQLEPGVHVNAVGSPPRPSFSELTPEVFGSAQLVVVDSRAVALADSGNVRNAVSAGTLRETALVELGEILEGLTPGRTQPGDVTIYNSVGIGLQDLAAADHVWRRAIELEAGTMVSIRD